MNTLFLYTHLNISDVQCRQQNVPSDVRLCDTFNLSETALLSFFSNAMHACIYVHITVRYFHV